MALTVNCEEQQADGTTSATCLRERDRWSRVPIDSYVTTRACKLTLLIDNSYSLSTSKQVYYQLQVDIFPPWTLLERVQ